MLLAYFQAQHVNQHSGGAVIAPWELVPGHTPDEWAEAAVQLSQVPSIKARKKAADAFFEKRRREHKNYSSYHHQGRIH